MSETKLILTPSGFKTWKLQQAFRQEVTYKPNKEVTLHDIEITVPKDYETDLASIPRIFWAILPPFGRYAQASVIHDYLYSSGGEYGIFTRKEADQIFYKLMLRYGTYKWKAKLMYTMVRIFGRLWGW